MTTYVSWFFVSFETEDLRDQANVNGDKNSILRVGPHIG